MDSIARPLQAERCVTFNVVFGPEWQLLESGVWQRGRVGGVEPIARWAKNLGQNEHASLTGRFTLLPTRDSSSWRRVALRPFSPCSSSLPLPGGSCSWWSAAWCCTAQRCFTKTLIVACSFLLCDIILSITTRGAPYIVASCFLLDTIYPCHCTSAAAAALSACLFLRGPLLSSMKSSILKRSNEFGCCPTPLQLHRGHTSFSRPPPRRCAGPADDPSQCPSAPPALSTR